MLIHGWLQMSRLDRSQGGGRELVEMELTNAESTKYQRRNDIRDIDFRLQPSLTSDHLFDSMAIHSEPKTASARSRQLQIER